ncbi:MAG: CRTAC1 family protein [Phycisphaerales bacterium]|nr:CRTAC1 family protein [Phycisphaerales bacterium]
MIMIALLMLSSAITAQDKPAATAMRFTDVSAASGLALVIPCTGNYDATEILEAKGTGLALIDLEGDGDLDLILPNGASMDDVARGPGARVFRNEGALRFSEITEESRLKHTQWSFGSTVGDVDGDGSDDIFFACFGKDALWLNDGKGRFRDATAESGLSDSGWSTAAAFADFDKDGDLDLYVTKYLDFDPLHPLPHAHFKGIEVMAGPKGYAATADAIFENVGNAIFIDRSEVSGILKTKPAFGLNLAILDFTGDGELDIFVGNDSQSNNFFKATAPFRFVDEGVRSGVALNGEGIAQATMGIAIADVDGNGRPDLFTSNFSSDVNTLHLNLDGANFDDRSNQFGVAAPSRPLVGWAAGFYDFDHDGDEDLLTVNGHVYPQASKETMDSARKQPPLLMERRGKRFERVDNAGALPGEAHIDRTAVFADFDRDGDIDVIVGGIGESLRVYRNDCVSIDAPKQNWIEIVPRDHRAGVGNHHAIGATITARATLAAGTEPLLAMQRRWMWGGGPFMSNNAPEAHFGLPEGVQRVDVEVRWSDGVIETRESIPLGTRVLWERVAPPVTR